VNIGTIYLSLGDYEKALFHFNTALPVLESQLGSAHVSVAITLSNMGIVHFILIGENILTFHSGDDDYYQEWIEEVSEEGGWVALLNLPKHVYNDFKDARIHHLFFMGSDYNTFNWRIFKPPYISIIQFLNSGRPYFQRNQRPTF
jgi:tetratricopeptide (TPR) repeat protein